MYLIRSKVARKWPEHRVELVVGSNGFEELHEDVLADLKKMGESVEVTEVSTDERPLPSPSRRPAPEKG